MEGFRPGLFGLWRIKFNWQIGVPPQEAWVHIGSIVFIYACLYAYVYMYMWPIYLRNSEFPVRQGFLELRKVCLGRCTALGGHLWPSQFQSPGVHRAAQMLTASNRLQNLQTLPQSQYKGFASAILLGHNSDQTSKIHAVASLQGICFQSKCLSVGCGRSRWALSHHHQQSHDLSRFGCIPGKRVAADCSGLA